MLKKYSLCQTRNLLIYMLKAEHVFLKFHWPVELLQAEVAGSPVI